MRRIYFKVIVLIIGAALLLSACRTNAQPVATENTDPIPTVTNAAGDPEKTETQSPTHTATETPGVSGFPNTDNGTEQIDQNQYWKEGLPLTSAIGKTAEEISKDYKELKFWGWVDGRNYFGNSDNSIYYFFDPMDANGNITETLSGEMVCYGFLTTLDKLFPSLPISYGNEPISVETFGQCLGLPFCRLYPDDDANSEYSNIYYTEIPSKNLTVIIYTDEFSQLPPNASISVV